MDARRASGRSRTPVSQDTRKGENVNRKRLCLVGCIVLGLIGAAAAAAPVKIGICKIVEHPALDAVERGVIDALAEAGFVADRDVVYLLASAQGDPNNAVPIAQSFRSQEVGVVVAISTPMALAAAEVFRGTETPIVFSAVTDPVAVGLVESAGDPSGNGNVTGVSDLIDVAGDLALLKELSPGIHRIGIVYNPGEANSDRLTRLALDAAPGLGLTVVTAIADSTANVPMAAQSLVGRVDAFYVTTDNTVVSAIDAVVAAAENAGVPFLMADPTSLEFGPVLATGFDYYRHGRITGAVVADVLSGRRPDAIPVTYQSGAEIHVNLDAAGKIGLTVPTAILERASGLFVGGRAWSPAQGN